MPIGPWMPAAPPARHWCHPTDLGFRLPPLGASEKQHPQPVEARKTPGAHGPRGPRSIVRAPAPLEGQRMRPRGGLLSCRRGPVRWPAALLPPLNATGPPRKLGHTDLATAGSRQKHPAALFPSWPPLGPGLDGVLGPCRRPRAACATRAALSAGGHKAAWGSESELQPRPIKHPDIGLGAARRDSEANVRVFYGAVHRSRTLL